MMTLVLLFWYRIYWSLSLLWYLTSWYLLFFFAWGLLTKIMYIFMYLSPPYVHVLFCVFLCLLCYTLLLQFVAICCLYKRNEQWIKTSGITLCRLYIECTGLWLMLSTGNQILLENNHYFDFICIKSTFVFVFHT